MEDIAPKLLEAIRKNFIELLGSAKIEKMNYTAAGAYADKVGEALAEAFRRNISPESLPDGKMYWNIADRVVRPMLEDDHKLVADAAQKAQQALNKEAGIGLKAQRAPLNQDRVDGILNRVSAANDYADVAWILDEPVKTFSRSVVDDTLKRNIDFQGKAGLRPKVIRTRHGKEPCEFCDAVKGVHEYPLLDQRVFQRHRDCRCDVEYVPDKSGRRQNVHTKKWTDSSAKSKIKTKYSPSPQRKVTGLQVSHKTYARLTGELNTNFPGLTPEDGVRVLYTGNYGYHVEADGFGGLYIRKRFKLK